MTPQGRILNPPGPSRLTYRPVCGTSLRSGWTFSCMEGMYLNQFIPTALRVLCTDTFFSSSSLSKSLTLVFLTLGSELGPPRHVKPCQ